MSSGEYASDSQLRKLIKKEFGWFVDIDVRYPMYDLYSVAALQDALKTCPGITQYDALSYSCADRADELRVFLRQTMRGIAAFYARAINKKKSPQAHAWICVVTNDWKIQHIAFERDAYSHEIPVLDVKREQITDYPKVTNVRF